MFIGTFDALKVVLRYIASTLCCRIIVAFELAGMRETLAGEAEDTSNAAATEEEKSK